MSTGTMELTDKGRWMLKRIRELMAQEGVRIEAAWELAESEADRLFPPEGELHAGGV